MAEQGPPSEEELREALDRIAVADVLLESAGTILSLGFRRVTVEARDLAQVRLAIEALRVLEPVLRDGGVDGAVVRDLEQARSNLQLAYASAVAEQGAGDASEPAEESESETPAEESELADAAEPDGPADAAP